MHDEGQVRSHSHESEGALEDEHEPRPESADGSHHRPQAAVEEKVDAARPGHRSGELRDAECGGNRQQTGEKVRQHYRRPGHCRGQAREEKEAGAEHRPQTDHVDVEKGQVLFQSLAGAGGGGPFRWRRSTGHFDCVFQGYESLWFRTVSSRSDTSQCPSTGCLIGISVWTR